MFFPPLIFLMMLAFFVTALILLPFLLLGMIGEAFLRLGLPPGLIFWLLISTLAGSLVNIPIHRFESQEVLGDQVISYFGTVGHFKSLLNNLLRCRSLGESFL